MFFGKQITTFKVLDLCAPLFCNGYLYALIEELLLIFSLYFLFRFECRDNFPNSLPKVLLSIQWNNHEDVARVLLSYNIMSFPTRSK